MKEVNRYTSNEFHDWQRENLPNYFVIQDIDTWTVVPADSTNRYEPIAIIELKRSTINVESWAPFEDDKPNYLALKKLADKAGLPVFVIYFKKGEKIVNTSKFAIFKIENVYEDKPIQWIQYKKQIVTAKEFKENFPSILADPKWWKGLPLESRVFSRRRRY